MANFHVEECAANRRTPIEPNLIVSNYIQAFDDSDNGMDLGGSANNILSLAVWNNPNTVSVEVSSPIQDIQSVFEICSVATRTVTHHTPLRHKRCCHAKKHTSMNNFMGLGEPSQAECSIHDSYIINMNRVLCALVTRIVDGCGDLGISFVNNEDEVMLTAIQILSN